MPKAGKDPTKKENYRSISLNTTKNSRQSISKENPLNWQREHIKSILHYDQVGFIPGMQRFFNICKSINVLHHSNKKTNVFISINAEKSFDKIQHPFMIKWAQREPTLT